jgi:hypothetical protein
MASTYSTNLKIELIGTGEQAGIWGSTTNTNLGTALEQAIVGKADVNMSSTTITLTLTNTNAAQNARAFYLNLTGTPGGAATLEVPAVQKPYIVKNGSNQVVTVKVTGQTGVAVPVGKTMWLYNNGTDVVNAIDNLPSGATINGTAISTTSGTVTSVGGTGTVNGISLSGTVTSSGNITLGGALTGVDLTSQVTGTLPIANGGTGQTGTPTNGQLLIGNGSGFTRATLTAGSGVSITNGSGAITIASTGGGGTVTSVGGTGTVNGITLTGTVTSSGNLTLGGTLSNVNLASQVTGTLPVANGGTGRTTLTSNNVILGAGTSQVGFVAPGTTGNVLTSNGTTWVSSPAAGGGGVLVQSLTFKKTSSQTITGTSEVDLTSWSATPSITMSSASNRVRATLTIPVASNADSVGLIGSLIAIKIGATYYAEGYQYLFPTTTDVTAISNVMTLVAELVPGAGTHTFSVTVANVSAAASTDINQSPADPTHLILEELTP